MCLPISISPSSGSLSVGLWSPWQSAPAPLSYAVTRQSVLGCKLQSLSCIHKREKFWTPVSTRVTCIHAHTLQVMWPSSWIKPIIGFPERKIQLEIGALKEKFRIFFILSTSHTHTHTHKYFTGSHCYTSTWTVDHKKNITAEIHVKTRAVHSPVLRVSQELFRVLVQHSE